MRVGLRARLATLLFGAPAPRTVRLLRGDIAQSRCDAIAVSANPGLEGVSRSNHWRFSGRKNADGAVRAAGGASLAAATAQIRESAVLEPGTAAVSRAGRSLRARWVVHCVAPDAIARSPEQHEAFLRDPAGYEMALNLTLQATFASALAAASAAGARSLAVPAIGCGVKGFDREHAGAAAFRAAAAWLRSGSTDAAESCSSVQDDPLRQLDVVVWSDAVWASWPACAEAELGPPDAPALDDDGDVRVWSESLT